VQGIPAAEKLPPSGLLAFFADHDALNGADFYGEKMLWGGGEEIASIVADVNRWSPQCKCKRRTT